MGNLLLARPARPHTCPGLLGPATPGISDPGLGIRPAIDPAAILDLEAARALLPVAQTWLGCHFDLAGNWKQRLPIDLM